MRRNKNNHKEIMPLVRQQGYTIVETMIFLAITGSLLITAMLAVGGQQRKTEFNTGIREIQSRLTDIMNDVSTGLYTNTGNFTCTATDSTAGSPIIGSGTAPEQGTNADCTFVGKVLQFYPADTGPESIGVYTLVGRRFIGSPPKTTDVRTLREAAPTFLEQADDTLNLPYDIAVAKVSYNDGTVRDRGSVAFTSRFAGNAGFGGIDGTQNVDITVIEGTTLNQSRSGAKAQIELNLTNGSSALNPSSGVQLCFNSGGTDQHAIILFSGAGRLVTSELTIASGKCV